jgi:hypothetical protein
MKIHADDWHFNLAENDILLVDLYLDNGQHALLQVNPLRNPKLNLPQTPEMIVYCEMPGERLSEHGNVPRWIARPPERACPWSHVELPPVLGEQIKERLALQEHVEQV